MKVMATPLRTLLAPHVVPRDILMHKAGPCEIAVAPLPLDTLLGMPFGAFVFPEKYDIPSLTTAMNGPTSIVAYEPHPHTNVRQVIAISDSRSDRGPFFGITHKDTALAAADPALQAMRSAFAVLSVADAAGIDTVAFVEPLNAPSPAVFFAMIKGMQTYLDTTAGIHQILIRTDAVDTARTALEHLAHHVAQEVHVGHIDWQRDPYATEVAAYLDAKNQPEERPAYIAPYCDIMGTPLFSSGAEDNDRGLRVADIDRAAPDYVRLISTTLLDRALDGIPPYVRTVEANVIPPYTYARGYFTGRHIHKGLSPTWLLQQCCYQVTHSITGYTHTIGEIALIDIPRANIAHTDALAHLILTPAVPRAMAEFLQRTSGTSLLPAHIYDRIMRSTGPLAAQEFDTAELDKVLITMVRHELAEILWFALPDELKERWKTLYPMEKDTPGDVVYYRNLLRAHVEQLVAARARTDFFSQETFADKLGLFWSTHEEIPAILHDQGCALTREERQYFDMLMTYMRSRRARYGSAFVVDT